MFFIFITKRPTPPLFLGGAEITHNFLAQNLTKMKHRVLFVGSIENPTFPAEERQALYRKLLNDMPAIENISCSNEKITYTYSGIECYLFRQHDFNKHLKSLLNEYNKQITVAILSMEDSDELTQIAKRYIPFTIGWLHSANKEGMAVAEGKPDILFSTSKFIKNLSSKWYDIPNIVFYPCFNPEKTCVNFGKKITFINPVKEKGSDFVLKLAKEMPHEQFIAVEGWYKNEDFCDYMSSNITYYPLQMDMNNIWNETKLLIVPSIVEEAFGRVIVEASIRGIPVIAHNKGGIAEALNGSGILLDNLDVNIWKEAINKCNNINFYTKLHEQALQGSKKFIRDIGSEFITIIKKRLSL